MQLCFLSLPVSPLIPAPWGLPKQKKIGTKIYINLPQTALNYESTTKENPRACYSPF
jgi:hypothetical protein